MLPDWNVMVLNASPFLSDPADVKTERSPFLSGEHGGDGRGSKASGSTTNAAAAVPGGVEICAPPAPNREPQSGGSTEGPVLSMTLASVISKPALGSARDGEACAMRATPKRDARRASRPTIAVR